MLHLYSVIHFILFFFFNDTATTEIYTLSLHDALPIRAVRARQNAVRSEAVQGFLRDPGPAREARAQSRGCGQAAAPESEPADRRPLRPRNPLLSGGEAARGHRGVEGGARDRPAAHRGAQEPGAVGATPQESRGT